MDVTHHIAAETMWYHLADRRKVAFFSGLARPFHIARIHVVRNPLEGCPLAGGMSRLNNNNRLGWNPQIHRLLLCELCIPRVDQMAILNFTGLRQ